MPRWFNNSSLIIILLIIASGQSHGQTSASAEDVVLLRNHLILEQAALSHDDHAHFHPFPFPRTVNPVKLALGTLMWAYQNLISPQLSASCIYEPSCSAYSIGLLREYGTLRGVIMTADRLMRCNRLVLSDIPPSKVNKSSGRIPESITYYQWPTKKNAP